MRNVIDARVAVEGQVNTSGTATFVPGASCTPGFGPGIPEANVTVPVPPVVVIAVIAESCALYAIPGPLLVRVTVTLRVPATVPSVRAPTVTASAGACAVKFA